MLTIPPLEKIISRSRSSKMRNTNAITNSSSSVTSIETRADKNGTNLVYHRSNCGYPRHRFYGNGGDWDGSLCGNWIAVEIIGDYSDYGTFCGGEYITNLYEKVVWYGDPYVSKDDTGRSTFIKNTFNNIRNESGGGEHNWTYDEIKSVVKGMHDVAHIYGYLCT